MKELEIPVKRGRGRPKGGTNKKRVRRSEIQLALDGLAKKSPDIKQALIDTIAQMDVDTQRMRYLTDQYARVFRDRKTSTRQLTNAIKKMAEQKAPTKSDKINVNLFVPVALFDEFLNIIDESPLSRNEIMTNLLLNYIKAHKSFSNKALRDITDGVQRLERQEYRNTKIAAEMLVNAPYDAIKGPGRGNIAKTSILDENTNDQIYAKRVDEKYTQDEVVKTLRKNDQIVDMADLFGENEE